MVSFLRSNTTTVAALLASLASTEAAYGRVYVGSHSSVALIGSRMPLVAVRPSIFSQNFRRIMGDIDEMLETMMGDVEEKLYEPLLPQYMSKSSYFLHGHTLLNALSRGNATNKNLAKNNSGITQDENQAQIAVELPDSKASDINIQAEEDSRLLKISGETKRANEGILVHSRFERSLTLLHDVDMSKITAHVDGGVLTITAPKNNQGKEKVRLIDIVEKKNEDSEHVEDRAKETDASVSTEEEKNEEAESELESIIDLDLKKR